MKESHHEFADQWYNIPTPWQKLGGVWLVRAGRNEAKPHYRVGPRQIECYGLHFILEGKVRLTCEDQEKVLEKGDLFCLFPQRTYIYSCEATPLRMAWLALDGPQVPQLLEQLDLDATKPYARQKLTVSAKRTLQRIQELFERETEERELRWQSLLYQLFEQLQASGKPNRQLKVNSEKDWLQTSIEYLNLHFMENVKIADAAERAGVHRSHFSMVFTKSVGISPLQYIQKLRMDKSAELLKQTKLTITEIALSVGYPDLYTFSRAFTRYFKRTPSHFRGN
ncbi:AraC family transcriptional regulator [Paenibacillus cremeus]|nr:AraC family transcriptional regulator [Paenibacillus cremeus]